MFTGFFFKCSYLFDWFVDLSVRFGTIAVLDCYLHQSSVFGFNLEPRGISCQAFISFLVLFKIVQSQVFVFTNVCNYNNISH